MEQAVESPSYLEPRSVWVRGGAVVLGALWLGLAFVALMFGFSSSRQALGVAGAIALVAGAISYQTAPPDHGRIRNVAKDVGVEVEGWRLAGDDDHGNTWCFKGCPEVSYHYVTEESPEQAVATYTAMLEDEGFTGGPLGYGASRTPSEFEPLAHELWRHGRWSVDVRVPSPSYPPSWADGADPGLTPVEVTYRGD